MPTTLLPLSGARNFNDGFTIPPDDGLGEALYDLRRLLRGEHRFESEISEQIRKTDAGSRILHPSRLGW